MMHKYLKECYMKKYILFLLLIVILGGCAKTDAIQFCEGVTPKGKLIKCGSVFSAGDVTVHIKNNKNFGNNSITIELKKLKNKKEKKMKSITHTVKSTDSTTYFNLPLYNSGVYKLIVLNGNEKIGGINHPSKGSMYGCVQGFQVGSGQNGVGDPEKGATDIFGPLAVPDFFMQALGFFLNEIIHSVAGSVECYLRGDPHPGGFSRKGGHEVVDCAVFQPVDTVIVRSHQEDKRGF